MKRKFLALLLALAMMTLAAFTANGASVCETSAEGEIIVSTG